MSYQFGHIDPDERLDHGEEPNDDRQPPRRHLPAAALAIGVVALFAGGLWFAYHAGTQHAAVSSSAAPDTVPLLRADNEPVKVKPTNAGGMEIPDKDNPLYGAKTAPVEKLLPPPEAPAARPPPPVQAQLPPPAPPAMPAPLPAPPPATVKPMSPAQIAALAKPPTAPAPGDTALPGGVRIQLASLRSPDAARDEWARLKDENADLLGKLTAVAVRADMGEKGIYYRIEAGPLASKAAAAHLCDALRDRDLGCQLVR
jgi:hypothetical protein